MLRIAFALIQRNWQTYFPQTRLALGRPRLLPARQLLLRPLQHQRHRRRPRLPHQEEERGEQLRGRRRRQLQQGLDGLPGGVQEGEGVGTLLIVYTRGSKLKTNVPMRNVL